MSSDPEARKPRGFLLHVVPAGPEAFGVTLEETSSAGQHPRPVARAEARAVRALLPSLVAAVKASGQPKSSLSVARRAPIRLKEEPGVRLALTLLAAGPLRKARRVQQIADGVASMSAEEAYYWYSKATGTDGARRLRALRVFLSGE